MPGEVHHGHRVRLREQAAKEGFEHFHPHQILEWLLFYAIPRQDVSELAHALIERFGSVSAVFSAEREELTSVEGIGARTADFLLTVGEAVDAYARLEEEDYPHIRTLREAISFCESKRTAVSRPCSCCVYLTPYGGLRLFSTVSNSTVWYLPQSMRLMLEEATSVHARSILLLLFFEGQYEPLEEDELERIGETAYMLEAVGANLTDILLVGDQGVFSLREAGLYAKKDPENAPRALREEAVPADVLWLFDIPEE